MNLCKMLLTLLLSSISLSSHSADAPATIHLDRAALQRAGIQVAAAQTLSLPRQISAYGSVLDLSPLALLLSDIDGLQASAAASAAELQRSKMLYAADQNISRRSLDIAQVQARGDAIKLGAARRRIGLEWGAAIAQLSPAQQRRLLDAAASGRSALLRVSVPGLTNLPLAAVTAVLIPADGTSNPIAATVLGRAQGSDPAMPGLSLLLRVDGAGLQTGAAVVIRLDTGRVTGVRLPRDALLHDADGGFVYRQTAAESFERSNVTVLMNTSDGWLVSGIPAAAQLVVSHAAAVHWAAAAGGD